MTAAYLSAIEFSHSILSFYVVVITSYRGIYVKKAGLSWAPKRSQIDGDALAAHCDITLITPNQKISCLRLTALLAASPTRKHRVDGEYFPFNIQIFNPYFAHFCRPFRGRHRLQPLAPTAPGMFEPHQPGRNQRVIRSGAAAVEVKLQQ